MVSPRVRLRGFPLFVVLACLLYVATWPGSVLRGLVLELDAPAVPETIHDRDGVLDVFVQSEKSESESNAPASPTNPANPTNPTSPTNPVAGVRVRAFAMLDGRAHAAATALSDAEGHAVLSDLPRAQHFIVVEASGYARASQMVVITEGRRRLDLVLTKEHVLDVFVKNDRGEPVANAELEVRFADPFPVGARTDETGRVHVRRLAEGPFIVTARATGYEEATRRRVPEGELCTMTLGRQGALKVSVVDERGEKVHHARVFVTSPSLWPARAAETDADGQVRIGGLDPGSYTLRAVSGARASPTEMGISVERGEEKPVVLRLEPGKMVTARIVDAESDEGIAGAKVTLVEEGLSSFPIEGVSDKSGRVSLGPSISEVVTIDARAEGYVPRAARRIDRTTDETKIALLRGGTLIGRVVDARGYPVDGATIRVVGTDLSGMPIDEDPAISGFREAHFDLALAGPVPLVPSKELGVMPGPIPKIPRASEASFSSRSLAGAPSEASSRFEPWISGRDGTFRAGPIPPGRVRAYVHHPQYVDAMSDVVTLASEGEASVTVIVRQGGTLEGRVLDPRGRPVEGVLVTALGTRGTYEHTTRTEKDGTFAFASVPESLTVHVTRDEDLAQVAARATIDVPDGARRNLEIVLPEPRDPLPVHVVDERGGAVETAQISAVSIDPNVALRVTAFTDARGDAVLAAARGIPTRIEVRAPGYASRILVTTAETTKLDVDLRAAERLIGTVMANRREAVEGAEIVLQTETGPRRARSDKEGAFEIVDAPPGRGRLRIRAAGRAPLERAVVVEERAGKSPTDIGRVTLAEEGVVEGVVEDDRGKPIPGARVAKDAVPTYLPATGVPSGVAVCDGKGHFRLGELPEGTVTLEAYAPDFGRVRADGVRVLAGRTTDRVKITLTQSTARGASEPLPPAGVAVTLAETTGESGREREIVVASVSEGSEAERAGLLAEDAIVSIGGARPNDLAHARSLLAGPEHDDVVITVRRKGEPVTLRVAREVVRR